MSALSHPLVEGRVSYATVSARTTGVASLVLFGVAFSWALLTGHTQLAFWVLSGLVPIFTPASLAISVAATAHGIGSWGVAIVEFAAAGLGLVTLLALSATSTSSDRRRSRVRDDPRWVSMGRG